jgi:4'-phosphopantetheinyl transferase
MTAAAAVAVEVGKATGISAIGLDLESASIDRERATAIATLTGERFTDSSDAVRRWTQIEAVLKADGRGLRVSPDAVSFEPDARGGAFAQIADRPGTTYRVRPVEVGAGFVMSLALARSSG